MMKKLWDGIFEWRLTIAFLVLWIAWAAGWVREGWIQQEKISISHSELVKRGVGYYDERGVFCFYAPFEFADEE